MQVLNNDIEFLGKHPFLAISLNLLSISITFIDGIEAGLKIIALIVSIIVGIVTTIGKIQEINKNKAIKEDDESNSTV
jgi:hypothetical protein